MNAADEHGMIDQLLPWYANGSLDSDTRRRIATHLESCVACRDELKFLGDVRQVLRHSVASETVPANEQPAGFESLPAELRQRVRASTASTRRSSRLLVPAMAAALFAAIGISVALTVSQLEAPRFRTATTVAAGGSDMARVSVRFAPEAEFKRVNELLRQHRAVIVHGPDEQDHWLLEIPVADESHQRQVLDLLNRTAGIETAEAVGVTSRTE